MKNKVVVGTLCIIIVFFLIRYIVNIAASINVVSSLCLYPVLKIQHTIIDPVQSWFAKKAHIKNLSEELSCIKNERDILLAENIMLKATECYLHNINEIVRFNERYKLDKGYVTQVLTHHCSPHGQFLLVDAGSLQGIKKDMIATHCHCLVGKVIEVYPWYCKVLLITDAECKVASFCVKTKASGIHEGVNDSAKTYLRYVSHLENVEMQDLLISSGDGLIFPMGFALGYVDVVKREDIVYDITVKPSLDFQSLRYCTLIAKEDISPILVD